jgi:hypothetical protein
MALRDVKATGQIWISHATAMRLWAARPTPSSTGVVGKEKGRRSGAP